MGIDVDVKGVNISRLQKCVLLRESGHAHKKKTMWITVGIFVLLTALVAELPSGIKNSLFQVFKLLPSIRSLTLYTVSLKIILKEVECNNLNYH